MSGKLVEITFPVGRPCMAPEEFKGVTSKGLLFERMLRAGFTPYKIETITGVKYQQVRNQLMTRGVWKDRATILEAANE